MRTRSSVQKLTRAQRTRHAGGIVALALLTAGWSTAAAQGPPAGGPPGLGGGLPPGQAKKLAAAQQDPVAAAAPAAPAPPAAPAATAPAPAGAPVPPGHASPPGQGRASAPGQLKKAAAAAPVQARAVATPTAASAPAPVPTVATPTGTPAQPKRKKPAARKQTAARRARTVAPRTLVASAAPVAASAAPAVAAAPSTTSSSTTAPHRAAGRARPAPTKQPQPAPQVERITRTITHSIRDVVKVVPAWVKIVIGALLAALLGAVLFVAAQAARNRRLRRQRAALLEEVGVLQAALLPRVPATVEGLAVSVAYRPAAGMAAGGDFYDVFPLERGSVGIIVGDVSGHGRETLGPATFIRHMVRSYLEAGLPPRAALQLTGNVLDEQAREDFATIVAAVYDGDAGTLSYSTAGHPPPIITGPVPHRPIIAASSPPAGSGATTGMRQTTVPLPAGSTVCFYTDGLSEARQDASEFGRKALERVVAELDPDASAQDLIERVASASDSLIDDVAVCLVRPTEGAAGAVRVEEIEVTLSDLDSPRLRRFFEACNVDPGEAAAAVRAAGPRLAGLGSLVLRVRMADDRSGVDVVPVGSAAPGPGGVASVSRIY